MDAVDTIARAMDLSRAAAAWAAVMEREAAPAAQAAADRTAEAPISDAWSLAVAAAEAALAACHTPTGVDVFTAVLEAVQAAKEACG